MSTWIAESFRAACIDATGRRCLTGLIALALLLALYAGLHVSGIPAVCSALVLWAAMVEALRFASPLFMQSATDTTDRLSSRA